jgi:hypothetical protein
MDPLISAQHAKRSVSPSEHLALEVENSNAPQTPGDEKKRDRQGLEELTHALADWDLELCDTLPELELAVGITDWIDPETGSPAEGQSPLHIEFD